MDMKFTRKKEVSTLAVVADTALRIVGIFWWLVNPKPKFVPTWVDTEIEGLQSIQCTRMSGYFWKNEKTPECTYKKSSGKNQDTVCPPNSYMTGIKKPKDKGGLDEIEYQCCQLEYRPFESGQKPAG